MPAYSTTRPLRTAKISPPREFLSDLPQIRKYLWPYPTSFLFRAGTGEILPVRPAHVRTHTRDWLFGKRYLGIIWEMAPATGIQRLTEGGR